MSDTDAEDLISHLCGGLAPSDREAFRHAAESALASSPQCWGTVRVTGRLLGE
jgi:hypothetical protein